MLLVPLIRYAAAAATATLVASSGRNALETWRVVHKKPIGGGAEDPPPSESLVCAEERLRKHATSLDGILDVLKSLERRKVIELHQSSSLCRAPTSASEIQGEFEGILLSNNRVMVRYYCCRQLSARGHVS